MAFLPTSSEWTRQRTPDALPYGVQHRCFDYCVPTPDSQLRYMPSPCVCTEEGPRTGFTAQAPRITSALNVGATVGVPFTYQIIGTNSPTSFNATGLPAGLTVNTATGEITGTPTTAGLKSVTLSATNDDGTGTNTLRINIAGVSVTVGPGKYGTIMTNTVPDEAMILGFAGTVANPASGSTLGPVNLPVGAWGWAFAYPESLGPATEIMVAGVNAVGSFTHIVVNVNGEDYNVYYLLNAGAAPVAGLPHTMTI